MLERNDDGKIGGGWKDERKEIRIDRTLTNLLLLQVTSTHHELLSSLLFSHVTQSG